MSTNEMYAEMIHLLKKREIEHLSVEEMRRLKNILSVVRDQVEDDLETTLSSMR